MIGPRGCTSAAFSCLILGVVALVAVPITALVFVLQLVAQLVVWLMKERTPAPEPAQSSDDYWLRAETFRSRAR
jgi:hypothetical protein